MFARLRSAQSIVFSIALLAFVVTCFAPTPPGTRPRSNSLKHSKAPTFTRKRSASVGSSRRSNIPLRIRAKPQRHARFFDDDLSISSSSSPTLTQDSLDTVLVTPSLLVSPSSRIPALRIKAGAIEYIDGKHPYTAILVPTITMDESQAVEAFE